VRDNKKPFSTLTTSTTFRLGSAFSFFFFLLSARLGSARAGGQAGRQTFTFQNLKGKNLKRVGGQAGRRADKLY